MLQIFMIYADYRKFICYQIMFVIGLCDFIQAFLDFLMIFLVLVGIQIGNFAEKVRCSKSSQHFVKRQMTIISMNLNDHDWSGAKVREIFDDILSFAAFLKYSQDYFSFLEHYTQFLGIWSSSWFWYWH